MKIIAIRFVYACTSPDPGWIGWHLFSWQNCPSAHVTPSQSRDLNPSEKKDGNTFFRIGTVAKTKKRTTNKANTPYLEPRAICFYSDFVFYFHLRLVERRFLELRLWFLL